MIQYVFILKVQLSILLNNFILRYIILYLNINCSLLNIKSSNNKTKEITTMKIMFAGISLNLLYVFYLVSYVAKDTEHYTAETFIYIVVSSWLISAIGGIMVFLNHRISGAVLAVLGSIALIPFGFITIFGASRIKAI